MAHTILCGMYYNIYTGMRKKIFLKINKYNTAKGNKKLSLYVLTR